MSSPNISNGVSLEAADEEILPEDKQKPAEINVKDMAYANGHHEPSPTKHSVNQPPTQQTIPEESEPLSPGVPTQPHQPSHHSPLAKDITANSLSLNELLAPLNAPVAAPLGTTASSLATNGLDTSDRPADSPAVYDASFPFPNFRPLPSSSNSPAPQQGMTIPPISSAPMSRNASAMSVTPAQHPHQEGPPPAPSAGAGTTTTRPGRSTSTSKPAMLGAIGEKKSFFQKMFHHEGKHDKEKLMLDIPKGGSAFSSAHPSPRVPSPHPRDGTDSPPRTPGTPMHGSDSDHSRPPSRAPSINGRKEKASEEVHAQPPSDRRSGTPPINGKPSITRRLSERSNDGKEKEKVVAAVIGGTGVAIAKEENVVASSGTKFTLKDLLGRGEAGKLNRKPSQAGSDRGSTRGSDRDYGDNQSTASLLKKYGVCEKAAIGKGATAVVRLAHKWDRREEKLYAVKEFRKRRKNETEKEYVKKLTSEFCISSTLHHTNVVETVDLVQDEQHHWCEVMEYCPGGDLYAAIKKGGMSSQEVECSFKQLLNGISYLHSMGVAHRDIKPENLLLDGRGHVKITDFGVSDVFRMCWEKKTHMSKGLCGSEPYIAPELFDQKEYDARLVDVWAAAVVFYCMQFQELPWRVAKPSDPTFATYLVQYYPTPASGIIPPSTPAATPAAGSSPMPPKEASASTNGTPGSHSPASAPASSAHPTPAPLNNLIPRECRSVIKHMLDPDPKTRWGIDEALKDKWIMGIEVCVEGQKNTHTHQGAGMEILKL